MVSEGHSKATQQRPVKLSNTLTGKKETLVTQEPGHVKIYACGVTVYDYCHIGHAMQAIFFDVIRRYLKLAGYKVTYVRNYTDVDDKIINRAAEQGKRPDVLAQEMIDASIADMKLIGVAPADHEPKVSTSIAEIIAMIQALITNDAAYATADGDVYYRVRSKADYGKLSNRNTEELRAGTREIAETEKEDPLDFALWKKDDTPGASWPSPWGLGRPGWHIECSAMAKRYLGESFDIHGGGRDLVFPHHENEIAQSESANRCSYASYWLHSGLLTIDKQKMSKSLGNHLTIRDFSKKWPGEVLRLAYLQQHYSSNVDFNQSVFQGCAKRLLFYYETMQELDALATKVSGDQGPLLPGFEPDALVATYHQHMSNDFGTTAALRDLLQDMKKAREILNAKKGAAKGHTAKAFATNLRLVFNNLGLLEQDPASFMAELKSKMLPELGITTTEIAAAIERRKAARDQRDFAASDAIRDELLAKGIVVMDTPEGTKWSLHFADL